MELTSEEIVTKLLSTNAIIKRKRSYAFVTEPNYDLSDYLDKLKSMPSQYGEKYLFVK